MGKYGGWHIPVETSSFFAVLSKLSNQTRCQYIYLTLKVWQSGAEAPLLHIFVCFLAT